MARRLSRQRGLFILIVAALAVGVAALALATPLRRTIGPPPEAAEGAPPALQHHPRFGCNPGPEKPAPPENELPPPRAPRGPADGYLLVDGRLAGPPIMGAGFNLEPTLWTCLPARQPVESWILDTFRPPQVRVGIGQEPWVPDTDDVDDLNWDAYQRVLASPEWQPAWDFIAALNQRGITPIVAPWGAPALFTENGEPTGRLKEEYFDRYAEYYAAAIDYLVRQRGLRVGPASVMNEPDCGDGAQVRARDFPRLAALVGERLAPYGVQIYGPDTCNAEAAIRYLDRLLRDDQALEYFAFIGTHQYSPGGEVADLLREMREAGLDLPLVVTEYTTYRYGNLDDGQEAPDEMAYLLEIASVLQSHMRAGADAALYWDGVDYLWLLHDAISKWGLLRGPQLQPPLVPRKRYYGMLQLLPYLPRGAQVLPTPLRGPATLQPLAVLGPGDGALSVLFVNRGREVNLEIELEHLPTPAEDLHIYVTTANLDRADQGPVVVENGHIYVTIPARSIATVSAQPPPAVP